ncbi:DUF3795 domain-containing protein [Methanorbis furvi]|uniref:DUF3795 domain-containing protein n=1 Tax=Methanorbis furvi TaxID=3028299 RepID=A0AAE4MBR2_9EURY|nr:hypothetical protein [Methanocorpusculaceae archaeon Ag1]
MRLACCGMDCDACTYPGNCPGCREVCGKPFWTAYANIPVCKIFDCCANEHAWANCGKCPEVPCERYFANPDPYMSEEDAKKTLEKKMENLRSV